MTERVESQNRKTDAVEARPLDLGTTRPSGDQFKSDLSSLRAMDDANRQGSGSALAKFGDVSIDMGEEGSPQSKSSENKLHDGAIKTGASGKTEGSKNSSESEISEGEDFDILLKGPGVEKAKQGTSEKEDPDGEDFAILKNGLAKPKNNFVDATTKDTKPADQGDSNRDPKVLDFRDSPEKFAAVLNDNKQTPDIGAFATKEKPVVFLGEEHTDATSQNFIAGQAEKMKSAGITHFGVEMPSEWQPMLDKWAAGDNDARAEFKDALTKGTDEKKYPGLPDRYVNMIDSMIKAGIKPLALDVPHKSPLSPEGYTDRNKHTTDIIGGIIKNNPDARIVALGGGNHSGRSAIGDSLDSQLKNNHGIESTVIHTSGGDQAQRYSRLSFNEANEKNDASRPHETVARFAKHMNINEPFTIKADKDLPAGGADAFLYIPKKRD